jgi:hypothetical protein
MSERERGRELWAATTGDGDGAEWVPQPNRSLKEEVGRRGKKERKRKGTKKKARQPMCNADAMSGAGFSVRGFPRKILKVVITALTSEGLFIFFVERILAPHLH